MTNHIRSCHKQVALAVAAAVGIGACTGVNSSARGSSPAGAVVASGAPNRVAWEDIHQTRGDDIALSADASETGHRVAFAHSIPTNVQPSLISFAIKMGAKRLSKGTLKNFIKTKIKDRLHKLTDKKLAKEFANEADQIVGILEDPWWSTAIGFIPIAGDAFDLARVPSQIRKAVSRAGALEDKVQNALDAEHKARQAAQVVSSSARYVPAPKSIEAFPDLVRAKAKTPVQGGVGFFASGGRTKMATSTNGIASTDGWKNTIAGGGTWASSILTMVRRPRIPIPVAE